MECIEKFMTETFEEDESYYIKMKPLYHHFYLSTFRVGEIRYCDFIEIIKTLYPNNYHKNHVKYGQCFTGIIDKNKDNMFCSKIYVKPLSRKKKSIK